MPSLLLHLDYITSTTFLQGHNYIEARGGNCLLVLWPDQKSCIWSIINQHDLCTKRSAEM